MWAFIVHPRTTDKDPLQARIQKIFPGGGGGVRTSDLKFQ